MKIPNFEVGLQDSWRRFYALQICKYKVNFKHSRNQNTQNFKAYAKDIQIHVERI